MLTYIATISIPAFFVPHYLGVFWEPLGESPADIIGGVSILASIIGTRGSTFEPSRTSCRSASRVSRRWLENESL